MNNWNLLLVLVGLLLSIVIFSLIYLPFENDEKPTVDQVEGFCGIQSVYRRNRSYLEAENDSINLDIGKRVFRNECASCHNKR